MSPLKSVVFGVFGMEVLDIYYILLSKKPKSGYKWLVAIFQRIGCTLISNCLKIIIRKEKRKSVMEDTAVRNAAPRMSCAVLASAAWRALKGASQAVCGPRGRSVVSAGSLPGVGSCCSASMWVRQGKVGHRAGTGTLMLVHAAQTS